MSSKSSGSVACGLGKESIKNFGAAEMGAGDPGHNNKNETSGGGREEGREMEGEVPAGQTELLGQGISAHTA